ncbi:MAG: hypothetical protein ACXWQQ_11270 [Pseudobdellovibrio sp.]
MIRRSVFLFLLVTIKATAAVLSEEAIYFRCHSQFVRQRPSPTDSLLLKIKSKQINAEQACSELLNEAALDSDGGTKYKGEMNGRPYLILRNFQAFHASWFPNKVFLRQETEDTTANLYDSNEMAYHLTYNLFSEKTHYSDIVTRPNSFRALRFSSKKSEYFMDPLSGHEAYGSMNEKKWAYGFKQNNEEKIWNPKLVELGLLVGLQSIPPQENMIDYSYNGQHLSFSTTASLGAGILGSASYLVLNSHNTELPTDGGLLMHRDWSKAVLSDLLCRSLPLIRREDAEGFVQKDSNIPFRKSSSCMQCHATIDPMAAIARHVMGIRTAGHSTDVFSPRAIAIFQNEKPPMPPVGDKYSDYHLQPNTGTLYFRNYRGELINKSVSDFQSLGQELAKQDDLYICAAKRYFEFMTGIDVQIGDFTSPDFNEADPSLLKYRNFVINLGLDLKKNQNLKTMIRQIVASDFYKQTDYGLTQ